MDREGWSTVYISQGILSAEVVKGKLELAGIPVLLRYESLGQVLGLTVDGLGKVEVTVPAEDLQAALALLEEGSPEDEEDEFLDGDPAEL